MKAIIAFLLATFLSYQMNGQETKITKPFTIIGISNIDAKGSRKSGEVTVSFLARNNSDKGAELYISTNKYNLKAFDENSTEYHLKAITIREKKEDILFAIPLRLKENDSAFCHLYFIGYNSRSKYIKELFINTTLSIDGTVIGDSVLTIKSLPIQWK